jgi:hypothetical protein
MSHLTVSAETNVLEPPRPRRPFRVSTLPYRLRASLTDMTQIDTGQFSQLLRFSLAVGEVREPGERSRWLQIEGRICSQRKNQRALLEISFPECIGLTLVHSFGSKSSDK